MMQIDQQGLAVGGVVVLCCSVVKAVAIGTWRCDSITDVGCGQARRHLPNEEAVGNALCHLGLTYKVTSTVAYQALREHNILRRHLFCTRPWPVRIHGTRRSSIIDADEFGVHLNDAN